MAYRGYPEDYLSKKAIVTVATTGALHGKEANQNIPEQPEEIAADVRACEQAGAAIVHLHARDVDGDPTKNPSRFQELQDSIQEQCDDIIVNFTSAGKFEPEKRFRPLVETEPKPEMASLDMGPMNVGPTHTALHPREEIVDFATRMRDHGIKPELEVFHVGQMTEVEYLIEEGLLEPPYYHNFILGMQTGMPPHPRNLLNYVNHLPEESIWTCTAIGKHQLPLTTMALTLGGHVRVGLEDNVYYRRGEKAQSNAQLVERTARIAEELGRPLATPNEAREMLGLSTADGSADVPAESTDLA